MEKAKSSSLELESRKQLLKAQIESLKGTSKGMVAKFQAITVIYRCHRYQ